MINPFIIVTSFLLLLFAAPLAGVLATGKSITLFASFPPLTEPSIHQPFSWPVFLLLILFSLGIIALLIVAGRFRSAEYRKTKPEKKGAFPWWGWAGLCLMALFWVLAWSRFSWFTPFQRHTFTPLWFSYIIIINALCRLYSGRAPLTERPFFFLVLFPLSALFWWLFEYLNQFVDNWYYTGVDYGPLAYSIHASISFSTVLPAVYSTRELLLRMHWFNTRFHGLPSLTGYAKRTIPWVLLVFSCMGLAMVNIRPEEGYPLLWIAPLLLFTSLLHIIGRRTLFSSLLEGDWRPVVSAALAALICGVFWEMWNYYSLAKWHYAIPYVQRFEIFEMPLLGYMGYLPFGLLCVEVVEFFRGESEEMFCT